MLIINNYIIALAVLVLFTCCDKKKEASDIIDKDLVKNNNVFPHDFFGTYAGKLTINKDQIISEIPMKFILQETDTISKYNYILVYGEGETYQERKYTLIEKDVKKGIYVVDENNGILLENKVVNNKLYTLFEVQGNLLTTFITFEQDHLVFEIIFANTQNKTKTYAEGEDPFEVISYPISVVQQAVLFKE